MDYGRGPQQQALKTRTPRQWLRDAMAAELDCVAVTDHNSGGWIDRLKAELVAMAAEDADGYRPQGYRKIAILPLGAGPVASTWHYEHALFTSNPKFHI